MIEIQTVSNPCPMCWSIKTWRLTGQLPHGRPVVIRWCADETCRYAVKTIC